MMLRIRAGVSRAGFDIVIVKVTDGFGDMMAIIAYRQVWKMPSSGCEARARVPRSR